ncbi:MAG: flagellar basal-body rod protein FlgG [Desulfobacterales bacterium]|jgi:flagellar basal-body rod protein FlgG
MIKALANAATGMVAQDIHIDVISNNLANVSTTGFKRARADFQDLFYQTLRPAGATTGDGAQVPTGIQMGSGVRPMSTQRLFTQGDLTATGNNLDMAIEGDGFFLVEDQNGEEVYTRAGSFTLNSDGTIVTQDGFSLLPETSLPTDTAEVVVALDGTVSVRQSQETEFTEVGSIELARFVNPGGLRAVGRNLYRVTDASGDAITGTPGQDGLGTIGQGYLEMANVQVVDEMVNMITAQRAYEANSKTIQTVDQMMEIANNVKR